MNREEYEKLAKQIFEASLEVHKLMGPGLLESVYEYCLHNELLIRGIHSERQAPVPLFYKGKDIG